VKIEAVSWSKGCEITLEKERIIFILCFDIEDWFTASTSTSLLNDWDYSNRSRDSWHRMDGDTSWVLWKHSSNIKISFSSFLVLLPLKPYKKYHDCVTYSKTTLTLLEGLFCWFKNWILLRSSPPAIMKLHGRIIMNRIIFPSSESLWMQRYNFKKSIDQKAELVTSFEQVWNTLLVSLDTILYVMEPAPRLCNDAKLPKIVQKCGKFSF